MPARKPHAHPVAPAEPRHSLHTEAWANARARVESLAAARYRRIYGALLDHLEAGWAILRPLQLAAEEITGWRSDGADPVACVGLMVDVDVTDGFRDLAFDCAKRVPSLDDLDLAGEAEAVQRCLRVLAMGAGHPDFPGGLRHQVGPAADAFDAWVVELVRVLAPVERIEEAVAEGRMRAPVVGRGLRVVE